MREHDVARRGAGGSARCHVFGAGRERGYPRVAASSAETRTEKLRLMSTVRQCPLCFQKRTLDCSRGMSAMCQKQTSVTTASRHPSYFAWTKNDVPLVANI